MVRATNTVTGFVNFTTFLMSIPILVSGIWLSSRAKETDCLRFLQWPIIVVGAAIMAISLMGFAGSCYRISWLLRLYLLLMVSPSSASSSSPSPSPPPAPAITTPAAPTTTTTSRTTRVGSRIACARSAPALPIPRCVPRWGGLCSARRSPSRCSSSVVSNQFRFPLFYLTSSRPAPSAAAATTSSSGGYSAYEASRMTCTICMTKVSTSATLRVSKCSHRHCFPCMKKHVEFKLLHEAGPPRCPHAGCSSVLKPRYFKGVLRPRLLGVMEDRLKESAVDEGDRVYCPVPSCSALMSRSSLIRKAKPNDKYPKSRVSCVQCKKHFCLYCRRSCSGRSSGHSCSEEERKNPFMSWELQELAKEKNWRRCVKCNHMIELLVGCYHVTCRCGHEFCYKCGASRISKSKAGCSCPLWNEGNIVYDPAAILGS